MDSTELTSILYNLHGFFNPRYFDSRLPRPIFTLSAEGRAKYGHFWPDKWHDTSTDAQSQVAAKDDEINLHSELGLNRPFASVAATVYHEMCHQAQHRFPGDYGKGGKNNYHNVAWHALCQRSGLTTTGPKGYTKVTPAFEEVIAAFAVPQSWTARVPVVRTKQATRLLLWECQGCASPMKLRVARQLNAMCLDCDTEFIRKG